MKKIELLSAAVLSILAAVSCAKEVSDNTKESTGTEVTRTIISASLPSTRTALGVKDGSAWPNYWKTGDQISVNGVTSDALEAEADGKATASFSFEGTLTTPYYAVYPASAVSGYASGSATLTVPAIQNYVEGSYDPAAFIMDGKSTDAASVALSPRVSLIHLSLSGSASITGIKLTGAEGSALSGSFTTDFSSLTPATVSNTVELFSSAAVSLPAEFFLCVPAGFSGALQVEVFDVDGGSMSKVANVTQALAAGQMYSAPTLPYAPSGNMTITADGITSSTAIICWGNSPEAAYTVSVYADPDCATLVDSYEIPAGDDCWEGLVSPRFCISGLDPGTTYYVKVTNEANNSNVLPVTTADFGIVEASSTPAEEGDVLLAEDFGELRWDSDVINGGVGYFATSQTSFANAEVSQFLPVDTNSEKVLGSQTDALEESRLKHWAQGANNNLYIHPGYIKLVGSKKVTHIVTPALDNIPEGKFATLEVEVTASAYFSESSGTFCTTNAVVAVQTGALNEFLDDPKTNTLDLSGNIQNITLDAATAWKTYKVTLSGVVKGNRLAFGAASDVVGNDARMNLSDIKVTLKALAEPGELLEASLKSVSSSTAAFAWTHLGEDAAFDVSKPYKASLYSDEACSTLVVSHTFEAEASCWSGKSPCFSFGGLAPSTTYWFVVEDTENGATSEPVSATTDDFTPVDATTVTDAAVGDVILAEDFSEIGWGPDEFAVAAGFVPSPKTLDAPAGVNPTGAFTAYNNTGQRIFGTGVDLGTSRLSKGWGFYGNSAVYLRNAYLRISTTASGARTHLVTPRLSGIPDGKIATIEVTVTATKHESNENDVAVFVERNLEYSDPTITDPNSSSYKKYIGASLTDGQALGITAVKTWETKTVTLSNVDAYSQLVIGSYENIDTKNRFSIADVKVKITELADDPVMSIKDDATLLAFASAVAGGDKTLDAKVSASFEVSAATAEAFESIEGYEGTLTGNRKTITGLTKPMFNELKGTVKDLTLNSTINITADQQDLGMLANVLSGTAEGCTSKGSVTFNVAGGVTGEHRIGGLIGSAASSGAAVTDCTNEASVTNETASASGNGGELMVGGVLGTFWGTEFTISACENTGAVTNNGSWNKDVSVGGIIGQAGNGSDSSSDLSVTDCTNSGAVTNNGATNNATNNVGGVIGWIRFGTYTDNANTGAVTNTGNAKQNRVGGLIGYLDKNATFDNNSNSGEVSNTGTATDINYVGGLLGRMQTANTFKDNSNSGAVSNSGDATNYVYVGGIVGYLDKNNAIADAGSSAQYKLTNSGNIVNGGSAKNICIGGLFGRNSSGYFRPRQEQWRRSQHRRYRWLHYYRYQDAVRP